jgi:Phosphopantetheine attachment site
VIERADRGKQLMAFYAGDRPLDPAVMRDQLDESLPKYMIPHAFHWRQTLPVTGNGKTDRKALTALAAELDVGEQDHEKPSTETEHWLAAAWAEALGLAEDQIGRRDHFFDLGGTSLSGLKLAVVLKRAVSFKDLATHPILADQADRASAREGRAHASGFGGHAGRLLRGNQHNGRLKRERSQMTFSSATSLLDPDLHPGKPPMLLAEATGDAAHWAAEHRNALRAFGGWAGS